MKPLLLVMGFWISFQVHAQQPTMNQQQCRSMAEAMIAEGRKNISRSTRPEDVAMLQSLTNDWQKRLDAGENPCIVYADIFNAVSKM